MNFKKNVVMFTILICILFSISCVAASDVNENVTAYGNQQIIDDENEELLNSPHDDLISSSEDELISSSQEDLLSASSKGTFSELQSMIYSAPEGSTITLKKDYAYDKASNTTGIIINKSLTINGNGHTLDGLSKSRIFFVMFTLNPDAHNKVVLKNMVFKNGYTKHYGGAIVNAGDLTLDKCTFKNNRAKIAAGAICSIGALKCKNSNFYKNTAYGSAGAIFSLNFKESFKYYFNLQLGKNGVTSIKDLLQSLMLDVSIVPLTDYITNCKFTKNVASGRGGAVYGFTHLSISSSKFTSNRAKEVGGAVYGAKNLYIKNSKFYYNKAGSNGGAVYFKCHDLTGSYDKNGNWKSGVKFYKNSIKNSVFTKNYAIRGGAIYGFKYADKPKVSGAKAIKCTFSDNNATRDGNEILGGTLKKCTFKNTLTLKAVKVKRSAKKLVLTAKFKKGSKIYKNKKLTFKFGSSTYTAKTNSKGIAKVTVSSGVLKKLKAGKTVKYQVSSKKFIDRKTAKVYK